MDKKIVIALLFIILMATALRVFPLVIRGQFMDFDTMAAVLTMKQTIANSYIYGADMLAGFPLHTYLYAEMGMVYTALVPYYLTGGVLGIFGSMYLVDVLFIILGIIVIYLFAKKLTGSKQAGIFGAVLYTISYTGIYVQAFNRWYGDAFIPVLLIASILFLLYAMDEVKFITRIIFLGISIFPLILSCLIWSGGMYTIVAYLIVVITLIINTRLKSVKKTIILMIALFICGWIFVYATNFGEIAARIGIIPLGVANPFTTLYGYINTPLVAVQILTQYNPNLYGVSNTYSGFLYGSIIQKMPFILASVAGFICSFLLVLITVSKFSAKSPKETRAYLALLALLLLGLPFTLQGARWNSLIYIPMAILGAASIILVSKRSSRYLVILFIVAFIFLLAFIFFDIATTSITGQLSPGYQNTMLWIANNTAPNSTFLTYAGDAMPIEYWANRQSYSDTNIANTQMESEPFFYFLFANAYNFSYLKQVHPDYLLVNSYWVGPSSSPSFLGGLQLIEALGGINVTSINDTNLQLLEFHLAMINESSIKLIRVYDNNATYIYKVIYNQSSPSVNQ